MGLPSWAEGALFVGTAALLLVAVLWFYFALGAWIDDAYGRGRWVWFGLLVVLAFPGSVIAWLIIRAMRNRKRLAT